MNKKDTIYYKEKRYSPDEFYEEFNLDPETEAVNEVTVVFDNIAREFILRVEVQKI